ncbi:AraC family transcriptional regulator [Paenibacillus sp. WQ 127069]|uniref:AraC family transcriptional regulator n=1 Tax=Paenibacillus baimaensis TaxID=2982185 RepID=A0ABT2UDM2_9BACL|nr:AraC family transcriptional regulator [Paenibacillus sp. WQ 127069]MCU6792752.1 AraC family transcriptional regulator [Paenibacillus sp. WQ 127069]
MSRKRTKILGKLRLFIFILVTLPVLVVSIASYYRSSDEIEKRVVEANVNVMQQKQIRMEQTLRLIDNMVVPFIKSSTYGTAMEQELASFDFQVYDQLFEGIHNLQRYQLPVANVYVINLDKKWAVDNRGSFRLDDISSDEQIAQYIKTPRSYYWTYEEKNRKIPPRENGYEAIDGISLVAKVPINSPNPKGLLVVQVPRDALIELIVSSVGAGKSAILDDKRRPLPTEGLVILDDQYRTIYSADSSMIGKDVSFLGYVSAISQSPDPSGYFETRIDGDAMGISYGRSSYNGWYYITMVPIDDIRKDSRSIGLYTIVVSVIILLVAWVTALKLTGRIYNPIQKLFDAIRSRDGAELNAEDRDELQGIYERFDTMSRNNLQMSNELKDQLRYIREYYVLRLLKGQLSKKKIEDHLGLFPHSQSWKWMSVLNIDVDSFAENVYKKTDTDLITFAIYNVVNEIVPSDNQLCIVILDEAVLVVIGGGQDSQSLFKAFKLSIGSQIQDALKDVLKISVNIGISDTYQGLTHAQKAFQESMEALKYRIRYEDEAVICIEEVGSENSSSMALPIQLENELIYAVKFEGTGTVKECLHQLVAEIRSAELTYNEYQFCVCKLVVNLMNLVPEPGVYFAEIFKGNSPLLEQMIQLKASDELERWLMEQIIQPLTAYFDAGRGTPKKRVSMKLIHMIETEYDSDLTLELCASRLSYSPNYLRRLFLEETGINFGEYLVRYRMDKAKQLLVETDMRIADIADKLRYSNSQNFTRQFRKQEGTSPGEYREANK